MCVPVTYSLECRPARIDTRTVRRSRLLWFSLALMACGNDRATPGEDQPLPARVRLLTGAQYTNAVRDLLGDVEVPPLEMPGAPAHQFIYEEVLAVEAPLLVQYRIAAAQIGQQIAARPDPLDCAGDRACQRDKMVELVERAFRRPLESDEETRLEAMMADGGLGLVVEAVFQAPGFVYRTEIGGAPDDRGMVDLTSYEIAAELSFLLLDSIPDDALWAAARAGTLTSEEAITAEVDRLLATPRVQAHLDEVVLDWLQIRRVLSARKDLAWFPTVNDALLESMYEETAAFVHDVLWNRRGSLRELLTSRDTFVDARLAAHYGLEGITSEAPVPVTMGAERAGILTHASVLTVLATTRTESIIARGMFVNRELLCAPEPGRPPFGLISELAGFTGRLSESQFAHYRGAHLYCSGCHRTIDPPGRALEAFDGSGLHREVDRLGIPVETFTRLEIDGRPIEIAGAVELVTALADSERVGTCAVDQLVHHALGRALIDDAGGVTRAALHERFEASGGNLVDVFRGLAISDAFRRRRGPR